MKFNQVNNNVGGDVNNAISEKGPAIAGDQNKIAIDQPKSGFWTILWKKLVGLWGWLRGKPN
ncbi:MAG: hypothetical protein ACJ8C4_15605 [Gemmataceae bacterium]